MLCVDPSSVGGLFAYFENIFEYNCLLSPYFDIYLHIFMHIFAYICIFLHINTYS